MSKILTLKKLKQKFAERIFRTNIIPDIKRVSGFDREIAKKIKTMSHIFTRNQKVMLAMNIESLITPLGLQFYSGRL